MLKNGCEVMAVATKAPFRKPNGKIELSLTKSWSFKEGIRALRRTLVSSGSQEGENHAEQVAVQLQKSNIYSRNVTRCDVWRALSPSELPDAAVFSLLPIEKLSRDIFASVTGPGTGLLAVNKWPKVILRNKDLLNSWRSIKNRKAHGLSVSLYEKNPLTERTTGEPNADAFVVRARCNSAFLAAADGVNWGRDAMQAARCAIFAVYEYLETRLYGSDPTRVDLRNTRDAAQLLFETFSAAQDRIVSCTTGLTTLCVALVLPVDETACTVSVDRSSGSPSLSASSVSSSSSLESPQSFGLSPPQSTRFALIVVSVGDSQAFLLSKFHGIREVTGWVPSPLNGLNSRLSSLDSTNKDSSDSLASRSPSVSSSLEPEMLTSSPPARDFRDAGGALGAVHKDGNPELHNLICAVTLCDPGDLVILGTDGLTDNFDPVITRIALPESPQLDFVDEQDESDASHDLSEGTDHSDLDAQNTFRERSAIPARSWYTPLALSPPPRVSIWPRPPPPPPQPPSPEQLPSPMITTTSSNPCLASDKPVRLCSDLISPVTCGAQAIPNDSISAKSLNFTNQLELNWSERRRYAGKELERVWHETDASLCGVGQGQASSRDLCEALMRHALDTTASKRAILQNPNYARLRLHPGARMKHDIDPSLDVVEDEIARNTQRKWLTDTLRRTPGKLDHATVVAYEVGLYRGDENEVYEETTQGLHVAVKSSSPPSNDRSIHSTP